MDNVLDALLVVSAAWAIFTDLRQRRIANLTTLGAALAALVVRLAMGGGEALLTGVEGWLLGLALLFVPFALGWMGAGDVKLLAAFGALRGPDGALQTALGGCILGGLLAIGYLIRERRLLFTLRNLAAFVRHPLGGAFETKRRMPFGPALAAGAAASMLLTLRLA